ncbi:MAG: site-specific integrase, partial [Bacteriovoracaceae bacterium]
ISFWEEDEVSKFLESADKKYQGNSERWPFVVYLLALNTGLRAGEIWGLKVKDINFSRKFINVERQLLGRERIVSNTKGKNIRKVPCNDLLAGELKNLIQQNSLLREDFVFHTKRKTPYSHNNFRNRFFLEDLKSVDVPQIRFHDLRHTALTLMVEKGVNLKVVQSIAGHSDVKTTMKYVHLLGSSIEDVASIFVLK